MVGVEIAIADSRTASKSSALTNSLIGTFPFPSIQVRCVSEILTRNNAKSIPKLSSVFLISVESCLDRASMEKIDPFLTPFDGQTLCPIILRWSSSSLSATSKAIFSVPISMLATKWLPAIVFN